MGKKREFHKREMKLQLFLLFNLQIHRCQNLDSKNILSYKILLGVGIFLFLTGVLGSVLMKRNSPKKILSEFFHRFM